MIMHTFTLPHSVHIPNFTENKLLRSRTAEYPCLIVYQNGMDIHVYDRINVCQIMQKGQALIPLALIPLALIPLDYQFFALIFS